ncbi:lysophospholipid acyltransferase family protein [Gryllotalpicola sp.]|uniref:lysophospholipid acyltransferase family protein n=1 Tax=Gryllotalpicola sp. TaxID=1932787 RepID=UPI002609183A|nr:lysophospholipid acyltransferase family protein [Gryllotalpicola sp.]
MARKETGRPSVFWFMAGSCFALLGLSVKFTVRNPERLPLTGAYVVAPNHYSEIDPVIVGMMLWQRGRQPRFLAKDSLFRVPVVGWFLRKSGQIPVHRAPREVAKHESPLAAARQLVEKQQIIVVYPEGSLTRDPGMWPMRGNPGAARIALEQGIPVIPVAHWGAQELMARYGKSIKLFPRHPIAFAIGEPVDLSKYAGKHIDARLLAEATEDIMAAITAQLETLRGEKAPAARWDPTARGQKEHGRFES